MNQRFNQFKSDADTIIASSEWLTDQINKLMDEAERFMDNPDIEDIDRYEKILCELDVLEVRSKWEGKELNKFIEKYRDILT